MGRLQKRREGKGKVGIAKQGRTRRQGRGIKGLGAGVGQGFIG